MPPRRSRRAAAQESDDDDEMDVDENDHENNNAGGAADETTRKANQLVRLALFHEHRRTVLKRDEVTKKVMGGSKNFAHVLGIAKEILHTTFGMELVELKVYTGDDENGADDELDEARTATGAKKKAAAGSKTFILRSSLAPEIIEIAHAKDNDIYKQACEDAGGGNDEDDEDQDLCGELIQSNDAGPVGVTYVILALILVSGRTISDAELRSYLKKLRLGTVEFSAHATTRSVPLDTYLQTLIRQGFIDRSTIGEMNAKKKKVNKRVRGDEEEAQKYEWRWGPRAHSEVGEEMIGQFVAEFMVGMQMQGVGGDARQVEKETDRRVAKMLKGIGKAAGGGLAEIR